MRNGIENFLTEINKVYDVHNYTKKRYGSNCDGGYVLLKEWCDGTLYSLGVGDDVGFEIDYINRYPRSKVILIDPTITELPTKHLKFYFYPHIDGGDYFSQIDPDKNSILKMDIEWDEWKLLTEIDSNTLLKFSQMVIEFHVLHLDCPNDLSTYFRKLHKKAQRIILSSLFEEYARVIEKLNSMFYIFHIHANNSLQKVQIGDVSIPPLLEVSFVRKDLVSMATKTNTKFPVEGLDYPNKLDRRDILKPYPVGGEKLC